MNFKKLTAVTLASVFALGASFSAQPKAAAASPAPPGRRQSSFVRRGQLCKQLFLASPSGRRTLDFFAALSAVHRKLPDLLFDGLYPMADLHGGYQRRHDNFGGQ